jgi:curli production assembly/transport component CsgG
VKSNATLTPVSEVTLDLNRLPPPRQRIPVAVYGFRDQTGQFKPSPESLNSSQVSQGVSSVLVKALRDSGWYMPVEREGLQNLLTERRIIRAIEVPGEKGKPLIDLPNLTPASLVVEGGVIAYESNVRTGGKGANYLGIGSSNKYSVDQVTVGLRMIDIRNGQILNTVSVTKTIFSYAFGANHYAYVSYQRLLQAEIGYTTNEPAQLAVRQAVESAVIHLTVQGIRDRVLEMKDETQWNDPIIQSYIREQEEALAEVAEADDDDIPMRAVTPDGRVSPVLPLLVKETESTNTGRSGSTQTDSGGAKSLGTQAAKTGQ